MNWFAQHYDATVAAIAVMVHPADTLAKDASMVPGARVITGPKMALLFKALRAFADALVFEGGWDDLATVEGLLTGHQLRASDLGSYTVDRHSG